MAVEVTLRLPEDLVEHANASGKSPSAYQMSPRLPATF